MARDAAGGPGPEMGGVGSGADWLGPAPLGPNLFLDDRADWGCTTAARSAKAPRAVCCLDRMLTRTVRQLRAGRCVYTRTNAFT